MLQNEDTIWLAAWLEGEGWFGLSKGSIAIQACSIDRDVIERVARLLDAPSIQLKKWTTQTRNQVYVCRITGNKADQIMRQVMPYMGQRRRQKIDFLLSYRAGNHDRRVAASKRNWADPDFKQRTSDAIREGRLRRSPEERSAAVKRAWETRRANAPTSREP